LGNEAIYKIAMLIQQK